MVFDNMYVCVKYEGNAVSIEGSNIYNQSGPCTTVLLASSMCWARDAPEEILLKGHIFRLEKMPLLKDKSGKRQNALFTLGFGGCCPLSPLHNIGSRTDRFTWLLLIKILLGVADSFGSGCGCTHWLLVVLVVQLLPFVLLLAASAASCHFFSTITAAFLN